MIAGPRAAAADLTGEQFKLLPGLIHAIFVGVAGPPGLDLRIPRPAPGLRRVSGIAIMVPELSYRLKRDLCRKV
jgi:hypothetical protein